MNSNASKLVPATYIFKNGYFVEGYVILPDAADINPELTVPYVGYKGKWGQAPIVDAPMWDAKSFYRSMQLMEKMQLAG